MSQVKGVQFLSNPETVTITDEMTEAQRWGLRVHEIRKALGPNARKPLSQGEFAKRLSEGGRRKYYGPEISLFETGKKPLSLSDALDVMRIDPKHRSLEWLVAQDAAAIDAKTQPLEGIVSAGQGAEHPPEETIRAKKASGARTPRKAAHGSRQATAQKGRA